MPAELRRPRTQSEILQMIASDLAVREAVIIGLGRPASQRKVADTLPESYQMIGPFLQGTLKTAISPDLVVNQTICALAFLALTSRLNRHSNHNLYVSDEQIKPFNLTHRDKEVLPLIAQGLDNRGIGQELGITSGTVANHLDSILQAFQSENRMAAALRAFDAKIIGFKDTFHDPNFRIWNQLGENNLKILQAVVDNPDQAFRDRSFAELLNIKPDTLSHRLRVIYQSLGIRDASFPRIPAALLYKRYLSTHALSDKVA